MPTAPRYPSLYQINTRVWLERRSREAGRRITLADIDDATIDAEHLSQDDAVLRLGRFAPMKKNIGSAPFHHLLKRSVSDP